MSEFNVEQPTTHVSPLVEIERSALEIANERNIGIDQASADIELRGIVTELVEQWRADFLRGIRQVDLGEPQMIVERAMSNLVGYGPLAALIADDDVWEIMLNAPAGAGFDVDHFRSTDGEIRVNIDDAINAVNATIINSNFETGSVGQMLQAVGGDNPGDNGGIEVTLTYTHDFIFGQQVFGVSQQLTATGNATLRTSDDPPAPGPP